MQVADAVAQIDDLAVLVLADRCRHSAVFVVAGLEHAVLVIGGEPPLLAARPIDDGNVLRSAVRALEDNCIFAFT